jgi:hypothetical protein
MTLPKPQPSRTCTIARSGCASGAGVIACADVATAKAKPAAEIILIIVCLLASKSTTNTCQRGNAGMIAERDLCFCLVWVSN